MPYYSVGRSSQKNFQQSIFGFRRSIWERSTTINRRVYASFQRVGATNPSRRVACRRCISRCKLSWPPSEWPVKRCLCGANRHARRRDDMSVPGDRFLSAVFGFHRSALSKSFSYSKGLLAPSTERLRSILCVRVAYSFLIDYSLSYCIKTSSTARPSSKSYGTVGRRSTPPTLPGHQPKW